MLQCGKATTILAIIKMQALELSIKVRFARRQYKMALLCSCIFLTSIFTLGSTLQTYKELPMSA